MQTRLNETAKQALSIAGLVFLASCNFNEEAMFGMKSEAPESIWDIRRVCERKVIQKVFSNEAAGACKAPGEPEDAVVEINFDDLQGLAPDT